MFGSSIKKQYLRWRKINAALNHAIVNSLSRSDLMDGGRNIGLRQGRHAIGGTEGEFDLLLDHCLYDLRRRDGRNAVERFAASSVELSDDQRRVLDQMRQAKFRLLVLYADPEDIVFDVTDVFRLEQIRFIDISLSQSARNGSMFLGHTVLTDIDGVWATSGAMLPVGAQDIELLLSKLDKVVPRDLPTLSHLTADQWSNVARTCFRTALKNGCGESVRFRNPSEARPPFAPQAQALSYISGE